MSVILITVTGTISSRILYAFFGVLRALSYFNNGKEEKKMY